MDAVPAAPPQSPIDGETEALLERLSPRVEGEPVGAYLAYKIYASMMPAQRGLALVCKVLGRPDGYRTQLRRWQKAFTWDARVAALIGTELGERAAQVREAASTHEAMVAITKLKPALIRATEQADRQLKGANKAWDRATEYERELATLYGVQLTICRALLAKLVPAVKGLKPDSLTARELAALLTAANRGADSAIANLSEAHGVTAYLEQARKELETAPPPPPDGEDDPEA